MEETHYGSICLTDIPRECIVTGGNGKKYLNIYVNPRREVDRYGNTHSIRAAVPKEVAVPEGTSLYVGKLKPNKYPAQQQQPAPAAEDDRMPWD